MSAEALPALIRAFEHACLLNQQALDGLARGEAPDTLVPVFEAKAALLKALETAGAALSSAGPGQETLVARALEVQARSARLETQLTEALAERQKRMKNVKEVTRAYHDRSLDRSAAKRFDIES